MSSPVDPKTFLDEWHRIVAQRDLAALGRVLHPKASMGAPPYWDRFEGADLVAHLLGIIVTFYAGDMIYRERTLKQSDVYDALPTPNAVFLGAKLTGLLLVTCAFTLVGILTTIGCQIYRGYYNFELDVYAKGFAVNISGFLMVCV